MRNKRKSKSLEKAERRAAALGSLDAKLDLGNGLTLANYNKQVDSVSTLLTDYNQRLSEVDATLKDLVAGERTLDDLSERMLAGVGSVNGYNSVEYAKAGGVPKSQRKRNGKNHANGDGQPANDSAHLPVLTFTSAPSAPAQGRPTALN